MLHPNRDSDVTAATSEYLAMTTEALGPEGLDQFDARSINLGRLAAQGAETIIETRRLHAANEMALQTFFGSFIPAVIGARAAAHDIAVTQGEFTPTDADSLAQAGAGLEQIKDYLLPSGARKMPRCQPTYHLSPSVPC